MIGRAYKYPYGKRKLILKEVVGFIYYFECGHWCTDNVFEDLIDCHTGIQNYMNKQLTFELCQ